MSTAEQFVKAWQESSSCKEAAEKLGLNVYNMSIRASQYRKKGIKLKYMSGGGTGRHKKLDIDALNKLIASTEGK